MVEDFDEPLLAFGFRLDVFEPAFDRWLLEPFLALLDALEDRELRPLVWGMASPP